MTQMLTTKEAGKRLGLTQLEVIHRLRRGEIKGRKWGWMWAISEKEIERVKQREWYINLMTKRNS